jgi:phosphatidylglycerol:prolipoprotein diacylglycerol transferase
MWQAMNSSSSLGIIVINIDPVLRLGPLQVHWYGIMYAVAFYIAYRFGVIPLAARAGISRQIADRMTTWTIIFGLIGGRLYYVVQQPDLLDNYILKPINIIAIWNGGMAFFGAIIVGLVTLTVLAFRYHINPWMAMDGGVLFAVVGQPIGRIGNLINGDILGPQSSLPWATAYANPNAILQAGFRQCIDSSHPGSDLCPAYVPAAAYEAVATIAIGVVLFFLLRQSVRPGSMAILYVALYAISQLIVFQFRATEPAGPLGLREAQWTSIALLALGVPLLLYLWQRSATRFPGRYAPIRSAAPAPEDKPKAKAAT